MHAIDRVAHLNAWRSRSTTEKSVLALGMLALTISFPAFPVSVIVVAVMTSATLLGARVSPKIWLTCLAGPLGFQLAGALSLLVQIDAGGIGWAPNGWIAAAQLTARSFAGLTCLLFLALTTPTADLLNAARRLGIPRDVVEVALMMYRFLFLLADTALTMDAAQKARLGHEDARKWLHSLGLLIANLLPRALDRAKRLTVGLAARCWEGEMRVLEMRAPVSVPGLATILLLEVLTGASGIWIH